MEITEVRITPRNDDGRLMAFANITFDHCFVVRGLKVITGTEGLKRPLTQARIECVREIKHLEFEGGHHLHMEHKAVEAVASALEAFYAEMAD